MSRPVKQSTATLAVGSQTLLARYGVCLSALLFVILALALYLPYLSQTPTMDDRPVFFDNPVVRADDGGLLTAPFYADTFRPIWRPLTALTLRWNWLLWPGNGSVN